MSAGLHNCVGMQVTTPDVPTCVGVIHIIDTFITRTDDGAAALAPDAGSLVGANAPVAAPAAGAGDSGVTSGGTGVTASGSGPTAATERGVDDVTDASNAGYLSAVLGTVAAVVGAAVIA